jgi:signal peptidase II
LLTVAVLLAALIVQPGLPTLALGLVLGGAAGNLADRLGGIHRVIDFIHVGNWFVCNVADVAITSGLVMMAYQILRGRKILQ